MEDEARSRDSVDELQLYPWKEQKNCERKSWLTRSLQEHKRRHEQILKK